MVIFAAVLSAFIAQATTASIPTATCATPSHDAGVVSAMTAHYPMFERQRGLGPLVALVEITLDLGGHVTSAKIFRSSGTDDGNREAMRAARGSKYYPKVVNCVPTAAVYLFRVVMDPSDPET